MQRVSTADCPDIPVPLGRRHRRLGPGTSAVATYVTGLVAQLIAKYGKGQTAQIKQRLLDGVDDLGAPGKDPFYGAGRVNLAKALSH